MNLRQMEVFRAVFMMRSVSGGARLLNVAQPSVSRMIRHLEKQLGYALFELRQGRIIATPQAELLFRKTGGLFEQVAQVSQLAKDLGSGFGERLSILSFYSAAIEVVPAALDSVAAKFPQASFSIDSKNPTDQIDDILNGSADVGIAGNIPDMPSLKQRLMGTDELIAVMPADHPLASHEVLNFADAATSPCIAGPQNSPVGKRLRDAFNQRGLHLDARFSVGSPLPINELVRRFKGIAFIGSMALKRRDPMDGLCIKRLEVPISYPVSAFWSAQAPVVRVRDYFVDQLEIQFQRSKDKSLLQRASSST